MNKPSNKPQLRFSISPKRIIKIFLVLLGALITWFLIHCTITTYDGLTDNLQKSDVAVVFGNEIMPDGTPSERLKARLQKAVELYNEGYFPKIIVSGGLGKEGFDEATVMKKYLVEKGIPANIIMMDHTGNNSWMTVQNTKQIMQEQHYQTVMAISEFYHMSRIELAFAKNGIRNISTAHADHFELRDLYSTTREFFGYYSYVFK
jgi:vancomycin permeability regulator SanA